MLSFEASLLDPVEVHATLRTMYWCINIPLEIARRSIANSIVAAVYDTNVPSAYNSTPGRLAAFARIISDRATFAYLCDVFVVEEPVSYRGRGLSVWMVEALRAHPELQGLRRWSLLTRDAHTLYERFGFGNLDEPKRYMEVSVPRIYERLGG